MVAHNAVEPLHADHTNISSYTRDRSNGALTTKTMRVNEVLTKAIRRVATSRHILYAHVAQATSRRLLTLLFQKLQPRCSVLVLKPSHDRLILNGIKSATKIGSQGLVVATDLTNDIGNVAMREFVRKILLQVLKEFCGKLDNAALALFVVSRPKTSA